MENRNGIMTDPRVGQATGRAECEQGLELPEGVGGLRRITAAAGKGYDRAGFVAGVRQEQPKNAPHPHLIHNFR